MLKRVLPYAHELIQNAVNSGDVVVDGTCGNGNDTIMLSETTGNNGSVYAFDIQEQAIKTTHLKLKELNLTNVKLIHDGHENVDKYLSTDLIGNLGGAIFNLGYLPGSDKQVITQPKSTIKAIDTLITYLKPGGIIVIVVYYGHLGGLEEKKALLDHVSHYEQKYFNVLQYGFINQKNNPPFIIAIEKK